MANQEKPIGPIELVGRVGYQLYSRVYYGKVKFRAKIGTPYEDKATGNTYLIPYMEDDSTRDYEAAVKIVAPLLEQLRTAAFRERTLKNSATISPVDSISEPEFQFVEKAVQELKLVNE